VCVCERARARTARARERERESARERESESERESKRERERARERERERRVEGRPASLGPLSEAGPVILMATMRNADYHARAPIQPVLLVIQKLVREFTCFTHVQCGRLLP
jgi:hypothetical protein